MAADRTQAINELLVRAEDAHSAFEATELNGVYDTEWAPWYAEWAVEHGIGALVGHDVSADELAQFLANTNADFERTVPRDTEPWAAYTARRIAEEL
jgi:hypothetical protein